MENINLIDIHILYGSQTGTAKFAAEEIERELLKYDFHINLLSLDEFNPLLLSTEKFFIFVVSTTGYGEPPSNMKEFWKYIMTKENQISLTNINYSIFGLGDTSYERFNWTAKMLNNRLRQLGANLFHPIGLGDEQHDFGYEGEFDPWLDSVIKTLNKEYFNTKFLKYSSLKYIPKYRVELLNNTQDSTESRNSTFEEDINKLKLYNERIFSGKITNSNLLTELERKVKSIEISTSHELFYKTGDIAVVFPSNDSLSISQLEILCGVNPNTELNISINDTFNNNLKREYPERISIRELFRKWLNINGIPNRYFCQIASYHTDNPIHKEKLELFYSKTAEGKDEFYRYCGKEKRTYVELLYDFNSVKLPLDILISLIGPITPREFSISSSNYDLSNSIELTVGLVEYYTSLKRNKLGICTKWLFDLTSQINSEPIPFYIKKGFFPSITLEDNVMIIATGTGIAPIRSFLWDRFYLFKQKDDNISLGKTVFFYGCRMKEKDYLYGEENELFENENEFNFKIIPAFSRDQKDKIYVYNKMKENSSLIAEMVDKNCYIILVGSSKTLPKYVDITLIEILSKENKKSEEEIRKKLNNMKASGLYYTETW